MKKNIMKVAGALTALALFVMPVVVGAETLTRQLQLGMSGSDVSAVQTYLATNASYYPSGLVTGYFGQLTQTAVGKFQIARGIVNSGTPATTGFGRIGPSTMSALNSMMGGVVMNTGESAPSFNTINVNVTNNSATISWNTNENASAVVYYGTSYPSMVESSSNTGVIIGGSSVLVHTDPRSSHSVVIDSLNSNTNYYYVLYVKDANGNESITWPAIFHTN